MFKNFGSFGFIDLFFLWFFLVSQRGRRQKVTFAGIYMLHIRQKVVGNSLILDSFLGHQCNVWVLVGMDGSTCEMQDWLWSHVLSAG